MDGKTELDLFSEDTPPGVPGSGSSLWFLDTLPFAQGSGWLLTSISAQDLRNNPRKMSTGMSNVAIRQQLQGHRVPEGAKMRRSSCFKWSIVPPCLHAIEL